MHNTKFNNSRNNNKQSGDCNRHFSLLVLFLPFSSCCSLGICFLYYLFMNYTYMLWFKFYFSLFETYYH